MEAARTRVYNLRMRVGLVVLMAIPAVASAEPAPFEASGFIGVSYFGDDVGLGDSVAAEQRPQTAPAFGARLTYLPVRGTLSFGGELEASYSPAETGTGTGTGVNGPRTAADAPVLSYRALLVLRLGTGWAQPFIEGGVGGATITTSSEFVHRDTDALFLWGGGVMFPMTDGWQLRTDVRQGWTESRDVGRTATYEVLLGIGATLGSRAPHHPRAQKHVEIVAAVPAAAAAAGDADGDGILDTADRCPRVIGIKDLDGCPADDRDHDRIAGALDRCPDQAEDYDNFEDADGCPDDDNDTDGIPDAKDKCRTEPETKNGIADTDGCPDTMPASMIEALDTASKVAFEPGRPRMAEASKPTLDKTIAVLLANPTLRVTIILHPDAPTDAAKELAAKRADVVKWHIIEQGVAARQLLTTVGSVAGPKAPAVELLVTP